jgi:hypothetical protein
MYIISGKDNAQNTKRYSLPPYSMSGFISQPKEILVMFFQKKPKSSSGWYIIII